MYSLPQEIEVWYVIPAVRRELTRFLTEEYGMSYEKTGNALGITKAAVSQYKKNKRAGKIKLNKRVIDRVEKSAKIIAKNKDKTTKEILGILNFMRKNKIPFEVCDHTKEGEEKCKEINMAYEQYLEC